MVDVDFGRAAEDYAQHRASYPPELFRRLRAFGVGRRGQGVLDLATGTGYLARGLARHGCEVVGIDRSGPLLEQARRLDKQHDVRVEYQQAEADRTGLPDHSVDVVTAGQCWHWFDRHKTAREVRRVLRPSGRLVIAHFDWLPLPGNVVELTEQLIMSYNPDWPLAGGRGLYPDWLDDVRVGGFEAIETFSFDTTVRYDAAGWRGRVRASSGVGASLPSGVVARFDETLRRTLAERFGEQPLDVPHCCWALCCAAPE